MIDLRLMAFVGLIGGIASCSYATAFVEESDRGYTKPINPAWSLPEDGLPMPDCRTRLFLSRVPESELALASLHGWGKTHDICFYWFFPDGRVNFCLLPLKGETADKCIRDDGTAMLPEGFKLDGIFGLVGRYHIEGSKISIELFRDRDASWTPFGVDIIYVVEEGVLTEGGFRVDRFRTRHRQSSHDEEYRVCRSAFGALISGLPDLPRDW